MPPETVTIQLLEDIYRTAKRVSEATGQPLDAVVQTSLARALPPLDDLPSDQATALAALALLDDGALWRAARREMPREEQTEIAELLELQSAGQLPPAKATRIDELMHVYGQLTVYKAHAYLLLARRGYRVPSQDPVDQVG